MVIAAGVVFWILAVADLGRLKAAIGCLLVCVGIAIALAELFPKATEEIVRTAVFIAAFFGLSFIIAMSLIGGEKKK